jgi:hypothetical protein
MKIKVSVCELNNEPTIFEKNWDSLVAHVNTEKKAIHVIERSEMNGPGPDKLTVLIEHIINNPDPA